MKSPPIRSALTAIVLAFATALVAGQDAKADSKQELSKLQPRINTAIDKGIEFLFRTQLRDGSWGYHSGSYDSGATALVAYALLKSGVSPDHPALRRAFVSMELNPPTQTYSIACCLMALQAAGKKEYTARMEPLAQELLKTQQDTWAYPGGNKDLSNTQYAVLGLRAAVKAGIKVPSEVWADAVRGVLKYQEKEHFADVQSEKGYSSASRAVAGFRYRPEGNVPVTGSMTTAGVGTLAIARECWPAMPKDLQRLVQTGIDYGVGWLAANFSVDKNPNKEDWRHYYLYGIERIGSVLKIDTIGTHDWYLEGARKLVDTQSGDGFWDEWGAEHTTAFALLFLSRASSAATGVQAAAARGDGFESTTTAEDVRMKGSGGLDGTPLSIWIAGFGSGARRVYASDDAPVKGLRVLKVEYFVDGQAIGTQPGDPRRGWTNESYAVQWPLPRRGTYKVTAKVTLVTPKAAVDAVDPVHVVESAGFTVDAQRVEEPWMDAFARWRRSTVLAKGGEGSRAQASSENTQGQSAAHAVDRLHETAWVSKTSDTEPKITVVVDKAVKTDTLVLCGINGKLRHRNDHDRAKRVRITVNGGPKPFEVELEDDEMKPQAIALPEGPPLRKIEIAIVERYPGKRWPGNVGFGEILLEHRGSAPKKK